MFRTLVAFAMVLASFSQVHARYYFNNPSDTTRYPINERYGDPYSSRGNSFDLKDTGFIKRSIEYDPRTKRYYVIEKIGNKYYRTPTSYSAEEFLQLQGWKDEQDYFKKRSALLGNINRRIYKPKFRVSDDLFNRI